MTQLLQPLQPQALASLLGLEFTESREQVAMLEELAEATLESCLVRFVCEYTEPEQAELETWVDAHVNDPTLTEDLLKMFPKFATILSDELERLAVASEAVRQAFSDKPVAAFS